MTSVLRSDSLRLVTELSTHARSAGAVSVAAEIDALYGTLNTPLRVAVAGQIKGGKSTLINALLEQDLLATGPEETTYNVNWLRFGEREQCNIRWLDGRHDRVVSVEELRQWTARQSAPASADDVRCVDLTVPNAVLRRMEIIDTPGLASSYEIDSSKTAQFLELASQEKASEADAIVFVLKKNMHAGDDAVLRAFRGDTEGRMSPLNAIGVLGQADQHWPVAPDPMLVASHLAEALKQREVVRESFFDVAAVSAKMALAPIALDPAHMSALKSIIALSDESFERLIASATRFSAEHADANLPPASERTALFAALDRYGLHRVRMLARDMPLDQAVAQLRVESGVPALGNLLERHFGDRAFFIKLSYGLHRLRQNSAALAGSAVASERALGADFAQRIERFTLSSKEALSLELLRYIYGKRTDFALDEIEEARRLTGEAKALGTHARPPGKSELTARIDYWRARANDARLSSTEAEFCARAMCQLLEGEFREAS